MGQFWISNNHFKIDMSELLHDNRPIVDIVLMNDCIRPTVDMSIDELLHDNRPRVDMNIDELLHD